MNYRQVVNRTFGNSFISGFWQPANSDCFRNLYHCYGLRATPQAKNEVECRCLYPFQLLCSKLGRRVATVIGSLVMAGGLFLCSFAPTIDYLYAFFGVLAGENYNNC
ncbi:hypothetical protein DPMN_136111 [Dreissena polymorpha]|uniref:Uncharacterized protein n=1 Tax=Dreissena polymorpha TaxID=45954 RepID=A0A9D4G311_DREPO|nr:hypothetical protein DPMN_136111 [Dreissena polymorpha]